MHARILDDDTGEAFGQVEIVAFEVHPHRDAPESWEAEIVFAEDGGGIVADLVVVDCVRLQLDGGQWSRGRFHELDFDGGVIRSATGWVPHHPGEASGADGTPGS